MRLIYNPILMIDEGESTSNHNFIKAYNLISLLDNEPYIFENLYKKGSPFIFFIKEISSFQDSIIKGLEKVIALFFSNNYVKEDGNPAILVYSSAYDKVTILLQSLEDNCKQQGWQKLTVLLVADETDKPSPQIKLIPVIIEGKEESNVVPILLQCTLNAANYILFQGNENISSQQLEAKFAVTAQEQLEQNKLLKITLENVLILKSKIKELESRTISAEERLTHANTFVELAKTKYKNDYDLLYNFYKNEYEVLPLWYKRVGHIIKVLMGKRTFRSLFNDSVKKYKD